MLKKIYQELVMIRKELQAIRSSKEFKSEFSMDGNELIRTVRKATRDKHARYQG